MKIIFFVTFKNVKIFFFCLGVSKRSTSVPHRSVDRKNSGMSNISKNKGKYSRDNSITSDSVINLFKNFIFWIFRNIYLDGKEIQILPS